MRVIKKTFDWTSLRQREKAVTKHSAKLNYLEIFLTVLFFAVLIITVAAFLLLSPLAIIPPNYR